MLFGLLHNLRAHKSHMLCNAIGRKQYTHTDFFFISVRYSYWSNIIKNEAKSLFKMYSCRAELCSSLKNKSKKIK